MPGGWHGLPRSGDAVQTARAGWTLRADGGAGIPGAGSDSIVSRAAPPPLTPRARELFFSLFSFFSFFFFFLFKEGVSRSRMGAWVPPLYPRFSTHLSRCSCVVWRGGGGESSVWSGLRGSPSFCALISRCPPQRRRFPPSPM